jgi:hypothetical protein
LRITVQATHFVHDAVLLAGLFFGVAEFDAAALVALSISG